MSWSIIINLQGGGYFVTNEGYNIVSTAVERAETILNEAEAVLAEMQPRGQRGERRAR